MSEQKKPTPTTKTTPITKTTPAAKAAPAARAPKKLVPRPAPKVEPAIEVAAPAIPTPAPTVSATAAATAKARPARKPSRVDETVAKHQKVLADALVQAQAINYEQAVVVKTEPLKGKKTEKPARAKKPKLVRDSYAMPENEYAQISELKKRLSGLRHDTKKSELLRAGIMLLAALNEDELQAVMGRIERIKTGRPAK